MSELTKAFVIGGWSEDHDFIEGLTSQISEGDFRFVNEAESLTLHEALNASEKFVREAKRRIVLAHSAGMMAVTGGLDW